MKLLLLFFMGICLSNGLYLEADTNQDLTYAEYKPTNQIMYGESTCQTPINEVKNETNPTTKLNRQTKEFH